MPINTGVSGRKVKSEEYFDDSFVYFLNSLWFRLPDDASHQDRHQGCTNPEIIDVGKVVSFYAIYQMLVALDEQTAHDVLDAGTHITRYADNAKSSTRCILRRNIYRHQTTEEAKQHADAQTEQYHRRSINPEMMARNQQEQTECQRIQQAEDNGWQITVAFENLIRYQSG